MKKKVIFLGIFLIFFSCSTSVYAGQIYQEVITAQGKVISGLSMEEALTKYGLPASVSRNLWYYSGEKEFYVYLAKPLTVYLYPRFCKAYVGVPLGLRTLAESEKITDVTVLSEMLLSEPNDFDIAGEGVIIPKKAGDYQIITKYKDTYSNPSFISVSEMPKEENKEEEILAIDILPYKPYTGVNSTIKFFAYGTILSNNKYIVRDLSQKAEWFMEQVNKMLKLENPEVWFAFPGKYRVFCKYKGVESFYQDIIVAQSPAKLKEELKHLSIIPSNISVVSGEEIPLHVFASYEDNSVANLTKSVDWDIKDKTILQKESGGFFLAKSIGISDVFAESENIRSLPTKVVVSSASVHKGFASKTDHRKKYAADLMKDIENDVKDLKNKIIEEEGFKYLKIVPDHLDIRVGEDKQLSAFGLRQNNVEEDITILAQWKSLDEKVVNVKDGKVNAILQGETKVYAQYKDLKSQQIPVIVGEPILISIEVYPSYLKIVMGERSELKVEGIFSDSSRENITSLVNWGFIKPGIIKVDKGKVKPIKVGQTKIYAEYSGIQSPPVIIEVVHEKYWLLKLILKVLILIFLAALIVFGYFYILTQKVKKNILKLYDNPRDFIISLYNNFNKIMFIIGMRQKFSLPPLFYAGIVDKKYAIKDNLFLKFSERFEEAKYSTHVFPQGTSSLTLNDYNNLLRIIFTQHKKITLARIYLQVLMNKVPLFIFKA